MPTNEFVEKIKVILETDEKNMKEIENEISDLGNVGISNETIKKLDSTRALFNEYNKKLGQLEFAKSLPGDMGMSMRKELETWTKNFEDATVITAQKEKEEADASAKQRNEALSSTLLKVVDKAVEKLKDTLEESWKELGNMLNYSTLSNQRTRSLALGYGFSASQSYGYDKAMSALGFQSEEDLMYANPQQIKLFREAFDKYSEKYEKLYDSGTFDKLLEFQVEMREFEEDIKLEFVEWFIDNKDLIKDGMTAIMGLAKTALSILSWLSHGTAVNNPGVVSDTIANYSNNRNTNISMNNTFNGVDGSQKGQLMQFGTYTIEQLVNALNQ